MIAFRRVNRDDFPLLGNWLAQPHVLRWWHHEHTSDAVERDFGPSVDGLEPSEDYLVLLGDRPIGLIQCSFYADYPGYAAEMEPLIDLPYGTVTIDYLIGEPDLLGRGLGTRVIADFAKRIWDSKPSATCIVVPVPSANQASGRALLGAGFHLVAHGDLEPDNPIDDPAHDIFRLDRPIGP